MTAMTRWLRRAFTGGAIAWAAALPAATFVATRHEPTTFGSLFAVLVYAIGSAVCHQLPERSFHIWGHQMPVCARCTGIYLGAAIAVVVRSANAFALHGEGQDDGGARRLQPSVVLAADGARRLQPSAILALAALPTAATLVFEWTTGVTPANWVRALAGLVVGGAAAWLVARGLAASPEVN